MNPKEAVLSPKELKALRRSGGGAAITAARAARGLPEAGHPGASGNTSRVIAISGASKTEDELVPRASSRTGAPPSQPQSPPRQWTSAAASVAEPLRGVTEYVICRHNKGSFSLYQLLQHGDRAHAAEGAAERVFVLAARAEGGGISSFLRLYTEPATSGLTPGKSAPSYVGKLTGGSSAALWLRRDKGTAAAQKPERLTGPKLAHLEVKYSKKPLPSGARQLSVRVPIQNTLPAGSASASYDVQVLANIVKGWHTFEAIDPWFLPESPGGAHPPLLALPLNGMAPSVKNVAMRVVPKVGAGNSYGSGFGGYGSSVAAEGASASGPGTPTRRTSSGGAWSGDGVSAVAATPFASDALGLSLAHDAERLGEADLQCLLATRKST